MQILHLTGMADFEKNGNRPWGVCYKVSGWQFGVLAGGSLDPRIYRGENKVYECFTPSAKRSSYIEIDGLKKEKFLSLYYETPYYQFGKTYTDSFGYCLEVDTEAVAQHYGFKTNYLDITRSREYAEFFAYTYYDSGKYYPITDFSEYCPCIYTADLRDVYNQAPQSVKLISGQIAHRPSSQFAMAVDVEDDFDYKKLFHMEFLPKDPKRSKEIYEKYYKQLFPSNDILGKIAEAILGINEIKVNTGLKFMMNDKGKIEMKIFSSNADDPSEEKLSLRIKDKMQSEIVIFFEPLMKSTPCRLISKSQRNTDE